MKLSTIKKSLEDIMVHLNVQAAMNSNNTYYIISNWIEISDALYILYSYDFLRPSVEAIFSRGVNYQARTPSLSIAAGTDVQQFNNLLEILKAKCNAIIDVSASYVKPNENQLEIKLPQVDNIDDLENILDKLNKSFTQCPLFEEPLQIKFDGVESGSSWLIISIVCIVGGGQVLKPVADFIKSCFECRKIFAETKKIDLESRLLQLQIDEETRNQIMKKNKELENDQLKQTCLEEAKKINPEKAKVLDPEEVKRLIYSMDNLTQLFNRGMEIYPSSSVQAEVKEIFPEKEKYPCFPTGNGQLPSGLQK